MKTYWSIPGPKDTHGGACIAFYKYDGSNLRFEWWRKLRSYRFGTRYQVVTPDHHHWGPAFPLFQDTMAEDFEQVFRDNPVYQRIERATVYCEFFGPSSFAGQHNWGEPKELVVIDVSIHKRGIVLPADFVSHFGHLRIAEVVYEGPFDRKFVEDVRTGQYMDGEGVVAKGIKLGKNKSAQHGLWMSKVKTKAWLDELKRRAEESDDLRKTLEENLAEQQM
jgi:hypothetical protein